MKAVELAAQLISTAQENIDRPVRAENEQLRADWDYDQRFDRLFPKKERVSIADAFERWPNGYKSKERFAAALHRAELSIGVPRKWKGIAKRMEEFTSKRAVDQLANGKKTERGNGIARRKKGRPIKNLRNRGEFRASKGERHTQEREAERQKREARYQGRDAPSRALKPCRKYDIPPRYNAGMNVITHEEHADQTSDGLLTKRELAARLRVSTRTVDEWMRAKRLAFLKCGKTVRFRWADVLEKLNAYRVN